MNSKDHEHQYITLLQRAIPSLPQTVPIAGERPDFALETDLGRVGLEVTRLFKSPDLRGRRLQVQESERERMVAEAMRIYGASGNPPVEVHVNMAGDTAFDKMNRSEFALTLATFVMQHLPEKGEWVDLPNDFSDPEVLPYEISRVSVVRLDYKRNYWSVPAWFMVQEDFVSELQECIDRKSSLVSGYDKSCAAHWLLVVIEGNSDSTSFEPSQETLIHTYHSLFSRVFLLERLASKGYELKLDGAA